MTKQHCHRLGQKAVFTVALMLVSQFACTFTGERVSVDNDLQPKVTYRTAGPSGLIQDWGFSAAGPLADEIEWIRVWWDNGVRGLQFKFRHGGVKKEVGYKIGHVYQFDVNGAAVSLLQGIMRSGHLYALRFGAVPILRRAPHHPTGPSFQWTTPGWGNTVNPDFQYDSHTEYQCVYPFAEILGVHGYQDPGQQRIRSLGVYRNQTPKYGYLATDSAAQFRFFREGPAGAVSRNNLLSFQYEEGKLSRRTSIKTITSWYDRTEDVISGLEVITWDGHIEQFGHKRGTPKTLQVNRNTAVTDIRGLISHGHLRKLSVSYNPVRRLEGHAPGVRGTWDAQPGYALNPNFWFEHLPDPDPQNDAFAEFVGFIGQYDTKGIVSIGVVCRPTPKYTYPKSSGSDATR